VVSIKRRGYLFVASFAATIFFAVLTVTVVMGFVLSGSEVIFPNVSVEGIDLSGMTADEANERLVGMGFERNAEAVFVTVNFPGGGGFSISGAEAGLSFCAEEAAAAALRHSGDASFFARTYMYVSSLWTQTDINIAPVLDENFVRGEVAAHTRLFNDSLAENASYSVNENYITIVPGSGFAPADEESVFELAVQTLLAALEEKTHLVVEYTPEQVASAVLDLNELYDSLRTEPVSAVWDAEILAMTEGTAGVSFDVNIATNMLANAAPGEQIVIPLIFTQPEVTTESLQDTLFRDILAERTTRVAGTNNRYSNVMLAASFINEMVLNPGDVFSFNQTVPRRTSANGFLMAGGFRDGQMVDMIGGGICQVSSTLYDNVLHSNLQVVSRRAHTLPISYLPLGHDAAIYYGALDFQFRNNTDYPIRIEIEFDGRSMTSRFMGTRTGDHVIRIESASSAVPFQTVYREDANVYGEPEVSFNGQNGFITNTYRLVYDADGNRLSRTHIARDVYRAQNRIVLIPPTGQHVFAPEEPENHELF
jgi:vancomycin resistance protein YoaR